MLLKELLAELEDIDPNIEVVIQTRVAEENLEEIETEELDTLIWEIPNTDDEAPCVITFGQLHIIANYKPAE